MSSGRIGALFFDVGETLIDESRMWRGWAAYLGVTADPFQAALQDVIAKDENHRAVFERFRPGFDIKTARHERAAAGDRDMFAAQDLYVDAAPCLRALRERGYRVGIAGNQPEGAVEVLRSLDLCGGLRRIVVIAAGREAGGRILPQARGAGRSVAAGDRLCGRSARQ